MANFTAGGTAEDQLAIRNEGNSAGQIGVAGTTVSFGGTTIGSFTGGTDGFTPLIISLNANADVAAVEALARNITYQNVAGAPAPFNREVLFQLTDGDGDIVGRRGQPGHGKQVQGRGIHGVSQRRGTGGVEAALATVPFRAQRPVDLRSRRQS